MSLLIISPRKKQILTYPHELLINGQLLGVMKDTVRINIPQGQFHVTLRSMFKFIETSVDVEIPEGETVEILYGDRERLWNILFNLDLALWLLKRIIHIGEPWDTLYEIISNGFFAVWLLRIWIIRKRYFKMEIKVHNKEGIS